MLFFPLFFSCSAWMSRSTISILIPHTPLYPIYQLSLGDQPTNRSFHDYRYLFLIVFLFADLSMSILLLHEGGGEGASSGSAELLDGKACPSGGRGI